MPIFTSDLQGVWKMETTNPNLKSYISFRGDVYNNVTVERDIFTDDSTVGKFQLLNSDNEVSHIQIAPNDRSNSFLLENVAIDDNTLSFTLNENHLTYKKFRNC